MVSQQLEGYDSLVESISSFGLSAPSLSGKTYDSARSYFLSVLLPLAKGGKLLSEKVQEATQKLPDGYTSEVDSCDLKESELDTKIAELEQVIDQKRVENQGLRLLMIGLTSEEAAPLRAAQRSNSRMIQTTGEALRKVKEKREKLLAYNTKSATLFSEIESLRTNVATGTALTATAWNGKGFTIPSPDKMQWAKEINAQWTAENMPKNMTEDETIEWLKEKIKEYGPDILSYIRSGSESVFSMKNGKAFLDGIPISQDSLGRLVWGKKLLYTTYKTNKMYYTPEKTWTYINGKNFENASGLSLADYHYSRLPDGSINWAEAGSAAKAGFKESFKFWNDIKDWRKVSTLGKAGKFLGLVSTGWTFVNDFNDNIDLSDGIDGGEVLNLATDFTIDLAAGASASALGAAAGTLFLPPLGTVIGAGVGMIANIGLNFPFGNPPKSTVDWIKDGVKGATEKIGDGISCLGDKFKGRSAALNYSMGG